MGSTIVSMRAFGAAFVLAFGALAKRLMRAL
jgi:hypothetical protein